jgi:ABC-type transport system involved in multi-copper enzyme maturation permease subunit
MTNAAGRLASTRLFARSALAVSFRDRTVLLLASLFLVLVLLSAYLGWSATSTVDAVYRRVVEVLTARGAPIPPNPVTDISPLSLLRNMATYIALIGALISLVLGHEMIAADRKAGVLPLIASRPVDLPCYAVGKALAIAYAVACLLGLAAAINAASFLLLPGFVLDAAQWLQLAQFYAASALYMIAFGLLGVSFAAGSMSESMALLVPVTIWLTVTFVIPQLTSDINPMAALNPVSALAPPPDAAFFALMGSLLAPLSLAEAYRLLAARLLDFAPVAMAARGLLGAWATLLVVDAALAATAVWVVGRMDFCRGDYRD